jgi:N,N'-diacetylchitobiose transport system substrate-binding protein
VDRGLHEHGEREGAAGQGEHPNATNLLTNAVNDRAAARSWFVPQAAHWVDVENGNILKTMLAQLLTGRLSVKQAATVASDNIAQTLNES